MSEYIFWFGFALGFVFYIAGVSLIILHHKTRKRVDSLYDMTEDIAMMYNNSQSIDHHRKLIDRNHSELHELSRELSRELRVDGYTVTFQTTNSCGSMHCTGYVFGETDKFIRLYQKDRTCELKNLLYVRVTGAVVSEWCEPDNTKLTLDELVTAKTCGKIQAMKAYRKRTHAPLMESKEAVEKAMEGQVYGGESDG